MEHAALKTIDPRQTGQAEAFPVEIQGSRGKCIPGGMDVISASLTLWSFQNKIFA
jgi:hypothetical protein